MRHELLLAFLGYTGDLIIDERERQKSIRVNLSPDGPLADEPTFKLAPDLSFIEPSDRFLSALISQSFLDIGSVSRILDGIMKLCVQFCWKIENEENTESTSELEHITEEFNKKSNSLYTILRRRFLLRLNFNSFFETTARGVLNVVRPRPTLASAMI